mmetsp:Transcript_19504/g.50348  ORF Transcript_19504/g.50348 Transcript_19504/m.50348 type:complete len:153 (-) Transcript_19504:252-710(-)
MMLRMLSTLLLLAPLACSAYSVGTAPRTLAAARSSSAIVAKAGSLNLKTQVLRAKMAAKGRHRLCIFKSNKHIYAQVIDDTQHHIIAAAASVEKDLKDKGLNVDTAKQVGLLAGERAKAKGIESVYFDRNGFKYHGRVAALADGAREAGLVF